MSDAPLPQTVTPVMRDGPQMLLVQEQGIDSAKPTWMLPGGRVAYGEGPELALGREILEETGLTVIGEATLAFSVEIDSRLDDLVGRWRALTYACNADGTIEPADPEGLIRTAEWVEMDDALERLATVEWYDADPLRSFLDGSAPDGSAWRYRLTGRRGAALRTVAEQIT
ncbi:MAG: NUDIX hydrolase [Candidatus Limnocylindria bacterium]